MGKTSAKIKKEKMKKAFERTKESTKKFKGEFKKTIGTSIIAAFSLIVAFAWKDVVEEYMSKFINVLQGKVISALIITAISVIAIMIVTKITTDPETNKESEEAI